MSNKKEIIFGDECRRVLLAGMRVVSSAVAATLGPGGRNAVLERKFGSPHVTKDGVTVAKEIVIADSLKNMGAQFVKEAASKTCDDAGDGTSTATVLAEEIASKAFCSVFAGENVMEVKQGMDMAVALLVEKLDLQAENIRGNPLKIRQVGTISANGDAKIGELIADAVSKVGENGVITIEEAKSFETTLEVVDGMQFDRGYISPYFATNHEKMVCEFENAYILVLEKKLSGINQAFAEMLTPIVQQGRHILIIAEDFEKPAYEALVVSKLRSGINLAAVKAPGFGSNRRATLEDICILCGATLISSELGIKTDDITLDMLGQAARVKITKDSTTIVGGKGKKEDIEVRCKLLKSQIKDETTQYDKDKLKERLGRLSGGVAVVKVGGTSEIEVQEKKARVEDALQATKSAIEEGILPGGGYAFLHNLKSLNELVEKLHRENKTAFAIGVKIIMDAIGKPAATILNNAGEKADFVMESVLQEGNNRYGYDVRSKQYGDMLEMGIIDPKKVVRCALVYAAAAAGMALTVEVAMYDLPEEKSDSAPKLPHGMPDFG